MFKKYLLTQSDSILYVGKTADVKALFKSMAKHASAINVTVWHRFKQFDLEGDVCGVCINPLIKCFFLVDSNLIVSYMLNDTIKEA